MASLNTVRSSASCASLQSIRVDRSKSQYTTRELFSDVEYVASQGARGKASSEAMRRELERHKHLCKSLQLEDLHFGRVEKIWSSFCVELKEQLSRKENFKKRAVQALPFGKFVHTTANGKLAFIMAQSFARTYRARQSNSLIAIDCPTTDINYSTLAHNTGLSKDEVKFVIHEAFMCIGSVIKRGACPLVVSFAPLGMFYADRQRVRFSFRLRRGNREEKGSSADDLHIRMDDTQDTPFKVVNLQQTSSTPLLAKPEVEHEKGEVAKQVEEMTEAEVPPLDLTFQEKEQLKLNREQLDQIREEDLKATGGCDVKANPSEYLIQAPYFNNDPMDERKRKGPKVEQNMQLAFERAAADLYSEARRLELEEKEAANRAKRSDVEYKKKLLSSKKSQREVNSYLILQTQERKKRAEAERRERAMGIAPLDDTSSTKPFPVEVKPDVQAEARKKEQLRKALDYQISSKKKKQMNETLQAINRERYVVECNRKIMEDDRQRRLYHKYRQRKALQYEWSRQCKVAELQRQLKAAEAKKESAGLLTVRSAISAAKK